MKNITLFFLFFLSYLCGYSQNCTLSVSLTSSSGTTLCPGSTSLLTATASAGTAPYSYIWSTGETTSGITINKSGTYTVTVSDKTQGCQPVSQSITITSSGTPPAPVAASQAVCLGSTAMLTVTSPVAGGIYQWYGGDGSFLTMGASYTTLPVTKNIYYYVQVTIGGCTSARTAVEAYIIPNPTTTGDTVCSGSNAVLSASGSDSYVWYDSNGNQVSTSATFTTPQPLTANTTYYVAGTTNGCTSPRIAAVAVVNTPPLPPAAAGVAVCAGMSANLHASGSAGVYDWFNAPGGGTSLISSPDFTTPALSANTTYYVQVTLNGCVSQRTPVNVTVNPDPLPPANQTDTICQNSRITLTASASPTGTYQWYDAAAGGNLLATGNTYTTKILTGPATYYVQNSNTTCSSARAVIQVAINEAPASPSVSAPLICSGSSVTLTVTAPDSNYSYLWYNAAMKPLVTGASYTTRALAGTTTYYVQATNSTGCSSTRTAVTVSVMPPAAGPTVTGVTTVCSGNATSITATGGSGSYDWYDAKGNYLSSGQVFITPALSVTTIYYVQTTNATGCAGMRTAVTITVAHAPASPAASGNTTVCPGSPATLTASGTDTLKWYDAATGGKLLFTGNPFKTPPVSSKTAYYVEAESGGCSSSRVMVTVSVFTAANSQFQYPASTYCPASTDNPKPVFSNQAGGTFSASPAGLAINPTTGQVNIAASRPGTYVISFAAGGKCTTTTSAGFTISSMPNAQFSYSGPYCLNDSAAMPVFPLGASAGVFSASPTGLVFLNSSTGEIDLKNSKAGTYMITNSIAANAGCPASNASNSLTLFQPVTVNAGNNQTVQSGSPVQLNGSVSGSATTKWSGGKGTFSNPSILNPLYTPAPGETSATLTLSSGNSPGPCGPDSSRVTLTIQNNPAPPTAAGQTVCPGDSTVLSATAPGGKYQWYDMAAGGNLLSSGPDFKTHTVTADTAFYVQTTVGGLTSTRTRVPVTVRIPAAAPTVAPIPPVCSGSSVTLTATGSASGYQWYDAATGGNLLSVDNPYTPLALTANTSFFVQAAGGSCPGSRTQVNVTVNPLPYVNSPGAGNVCSGTAENYAITANVPSTSFIWSRDTVAGISNPAVSNQTSATINETLINTTNKAVNVTYSITPVANGCTGADFKYVVTVNPEPIVLTADTAAVCSGNPVNYYIKFKDPKTTFSWARAAIPGISNSPVSGQTNNAIQEVLYNTTDLPIKVTYTFINENAACNGVPFNLAVTVNPAAIITSAAADTACSGVPEGYPIKSNVLTATFSWSRPYVDGVSNPAATNQTSPTIEETLTNTSAAPVKVNYIITPLAYGCSGAPFTYSVLLRPQPQPAAAASNSPVCLDNTIQLNTPTIAKAAYMWVGPNGFSSSAQNPGIPNATTAASGKYYLFVIVNGCISPPDSVNVTVDAQPVANAGPDQMACAQVDTIQLAGTVTGGTTTGIWTGGSDMFLPSSNQLNAKYIPSAQDKANGSVKLTLTSTSKDNCNISTSSMTITFRQVPGANAGPDQSVCSQVSAVKLNGTILTTGGGLWTTSGDGSFSPSATALDADYLPGAADIKNGAVTLVLTATSASVCYFPTDTMVIHFTAPPKVNAGGTRYVLKGNTITLMPTVSEKNVHYLWSPDEGINNDTLKNPVITGEVNRTYTLTVTDSRGCTVTGQTFIVVSPQITVPNTFTPNGDGINDVWNIVGLIAYNNATVDIFNRYGTKLYHSAGYNIPWDGTYNGKPVPVGTYYYIIDTKVNNQVLSGFVEVIR